MSLLWFRNENSLSNAFKIRQPKIFCKRITIITSCFSSSYIQKILQKQEAGGREHPSPPPPAPPPNLHMYNVLIWGFSWPASKFSFSSKRIMRGHEGQGHVTLPSPFLQPNLSLCRSHVT